ncbi:MAG TPA: RNA pseudouridine synthase [Clostridiales bacterium]|nr:MAG: RNA pseudouridine synthase [Clostridiales bacterium GWD2_32_19]HCC08038.1 RNA pseudouridine synthase [Clostridiales bacterium]
MEKYTFVVEDNDDGDRIDKYLDRNIVDYSKMDIKKNIDKGNLFINGIVGKPSSKLKSLDMIEFNIYGVTEMRAVPEDITIDIVYEDEDIIIVNKPQGMVVHPSPGHRSGTLLNALLYYLKENSLKNEIAIKPGIVHRIDQDTSGIIVVAKNIEAHSHLSKQFASHTINRRYHAIVHNNIVEDNGEIDGPICRDAVDTKKRVVDYTNGKDAITHYKVLKRFGNFTYVECNLTTGRTHQIRVHMAYINHPLLGDELYGSNINTYKLLGQALHAKVLGFIHPTTNKYVEFEKEVPEYFKKLLEEFELQL